MKHIPTDKIRFVLDGVEYAWGGGFGGLIYSAEKGLKPGDLRAIGDILFKVFSVSKQRTLFKTYYSVAWCPVQDVTSEWIREFKRAIFL